MEDVQYVQTWEEEGCYPYAHRITISVESMRAELARLSALAPESAQLEYRKQIKAAPLPEYVRGMYLVMALQKTQQTDEGVQAILDSLDERGGWRDEVSIMDPFSPFTAPHKAMTAYTTGGYIARMYRLINAL